MKNRLLIVAGVILVVALAFGMGFWKEAQATNQKMEHILDLSRILTLAENRGSDWATDELMINEIETFSKKNLYKKWGNPTESAEGAKEDIWILSEQFRLIVDYDEHERVESVKVVPSTYANTHLSNKDKISNKDQKSKGEFINTPLPIKAHFQ